MNINDLPPGIAALARKRQQECRRITRAEIAKALNIEGDNFEIVD